jgi:hypothetical protein
MSYKTTVLQMHVFISAQWKFLCCVMQHFAREERVGTICIPNVCFVDPPKGGTFFLPWFGAKCGWMETQVLKNMKGWWPYLQRCLQWLWKRFWTKKSDHQPWNRMSRTPVRRVRQKKERVVLHILIVKSVVRYVYSFLGTQMFWENLWRCVWTWLARRMSRIYVGLYICFTMWCVCIHMYMFQYANFSMPDECQDRHKWLWAFVKLCKNWGKPDSYGPCAK